MFFRSIISFSVLAFHLSNAAPLPDDPSSPAVPTASETATLLPLATPEANIFAFTVSTVQASLPLTAGSASLPPPDGLTLKYITMGHGVQNYTCSKPSNNSTPVAVGALATLYDITPLALLSPDLASTLSALTAVLPLTSSFIVPGTPLALTDVGTFPVLGGHFFLADGTPTFDLFASGERILAKLKEKISAPAEASRGLEATGAVPWLALVAKEGSVGLEAVYRVQTAGGNPPATCAGIEGVISVPYAAAYHFYG